MDVLEEVIALMIRGLSPKSSRGSPRARRRLWRNFDSLVIWFKLDFVLICVPLQRNTCHCRSCSYFCPLLLFSFHFHIDLLLFGRCN